MRASFAVVLVLLAAATQASAEVIPSVRLDFVEVLELRGGSWSSVYLPVSSSTVRFVTTAEVVVVRTDPSSGLTPVSVLLDGAPPPPVAGTGIFWNFAVVRPGGGSHEVLVVFNSTRSWQALLYLVGLQGGEARPGANITVPELPGMAPAGVLLRLLVPDPRSLASTVSAPYFTLSIAETTIMGEKIYAVEVLVPRSWVLLGTNFFKCTYYYLYSAPRAYAAALKLGEAQVFTLANHPSLAQASSNLLLGNPPHVALVAGVADLPLSSYAVTVSVKTPENVCVGRVDYRVLPPAGARVTGGSVLLGENTTLSVRFYRDGLAAVDLVVTSPPPSLEVPTPLYSLTLDVRDSCGSPVPSGFVDLMLQGRVVARAQILNGTASFCGVTPGEYVLAVYRWGVITARRGIHIGGDTALTLLVNATTVELRVFRQGVGELLANYTVLLRGRGYAEAVRASDKAVFAGVPPGSYVAEIAKDGVPLAVVNLTVSLEVGALSLNLPVYRLRVRVLDALDRPLMGAIVVLRGNGFEVNRTVGPGGTADFGYLPSGNYLLNVEIGSYAHSERLVLSGDSYKTLRTSVIAALNAFVVTTEHVYSAGAAVALLALALLLRSVIRRVRRKSEGVIEV